MGTLLTDLRHGLRLLIKSPGLALAAILTLALCVGANTAIFTVFSAVLLRPLPFAEPERLVGVWDVQPQLDRAPASYPEYLDWRQQTEVFEEVAAHFTTRVTLTGEEEPVSLRALRHSSNLLPMLGAAPSLGRGFLPAEEARGGERVAMISHGLWRSRFAGAADVLGSKLVLDGEPFTIVGVLPRSLRLGPNTEVDLALPLRLDETVAPRGLHFLQVGARLRRGLDAAAARPVLAGVAERLRRERAILHGIDLEGLHDAMVAEARPALLLMAGAVGLVLLIGCANVSNLLLAHAGARRKELAVRLALGARRGRLVVQLLTESLVLGLIAGATGLLASWWLVDAIASAPGAGIPDVNDLRVDGAVTGFALGLSLLSVLLAGLIPAVHAASSEPERWLKETGRHAGAGPSGRRLHGALVAAEVALSLVLLAGAGLLLRSLARVLDVDKGFDPERLLALEVGLEPRRYAEGARKIAFFEETLGRIGSLPGVRGAAAVSHLPLGGDDTNGEVLIEGREFPPDARPLSDLRLASPGYFAVMGIPVEAGRAFTAQDREGAQPVAIVNETFARRFLEGRDPIGLRIDAQWDEAGWRVVVGVVGDVLHETLDRPHLPEVYLPLAQRAPSVTSMTLVVRTAADPAAEAAAVRSQVFAVDREQPVSSIRTMDEVVAASVAGRRFSTSLLAGFAATALLLAAVGLYGVLSFAVSQRTREIGVRMALGARPRDVLAVVVGDGVRLWTAGAALGLAAALPLARVLESLLFGVAPADPVTFTAAPLVLLGVCLIASWLPARRAARVDPMLALRHE